MKVRTGFVSNSSSSSFCVFGIHFSKDREDVLTQALTGIDPNEVKTVPGCSCDISRDIMRDTGMNFCPKCGSELFVEETYEPDSLQDELYKAAQKHGLYCGYWEPDSDAPYGWYIGLELGGRTEITGEAQLEEMKNSMEKMRELFGKDARIKIYSGTQGG